MFHWICPECGREIPPAVKECPACDPRARLAPVEMAPAHEREPSPDPLLALAEHIRKAQQAPLPEPELVAIGVAAAVAVAVAEPEPLAIASPAPLQISITQFFPKCEAVALLPPPPEVETIPPAPLAASTTVPVSAAVVAHAPEMAKPQPVPNATAMITDLPPETFPSGSWLRLAPLQNYTVAAGKRMRPAPPRDGVLLSEAGPRITLPGPTLPPNLASLQNARVVTFIGEPKRSGRRLPGWLVSAIVMLGIPAAGGMVLLFFQPVERSEAKAPAPAPVTTTVSAPAPVTHSLADFIEVTGFRFVVDFNKKSEIHYIVVNHSNAALSDVTVYVTVHTADGKPGQPALCRFSFRAPTLAPFESKEMTSPIEKLSRAVVLPDWQELRADVQVGQ